MYILVYGEVKHKNFKETLSKEENKP